MRAVLLASATAASLVGLRASSARTHSPSRVGRLRAWRSTATAPAVSRLQMYLSPRLLVRPKRSLPPLEFCRGVIPSQAANSRPNRNREGSATVAAIALAPMMPTPGTVASNRLIRLCRCHLARRPFDLSDSDHCAVQLVDDRLQDRARELRKPLLLMGNCLGQDLGMP